MRMRKMAAWMILRLLLGMFRLGRLRRRHRRRSRIERRVRMDVVGPMALEGCIHIHNVNYQIVDLIAWIIGKSHIIFLFCFCFWAYRYLGYLAHTHASTYVKSKSFLWLFTWIAMSFLSSVCIRVFNYFLACIVLNPPTTYQRIWWIG